MQAWQNGRRLKMELKTYEHKMVRGGLTGTVWENLTFFLSGCKEHGPNSGLQMTFCKEVLADNLLKYEKKVPEAFLIGKDFIKLKFMNRQLMILLMIA